MGLHDFLKSRVPELWHKLMDNFHVQHDKTADKPSITRSKEENKSVFKYSPKIKMGDLNRVQAQALAHHISHELFGGRKLEAKKNPELLGELNSEYLEHRVGVPINKNMPNEHKSLNDFARHHLANVIQDTINSNGNFEDSLTKYLGKHPPKSYTHRALRGLFNNRQLYGQLKKATKIDQPLAKDPKSPPEKINPPVNPKQD